MKTVGTIALNKALQLLVSPAFSVKVSHVKRVITIDVKEQVTLVDHI